MHHELHFGGPNVFIPPRRSERIWTGACWPMLPVILILLVNCTRQDLSTTGPTGHRVYASVTTAAVTDRTMGDLSPIAWHLMVALRDPSVRTELFRAIHSTQERNALVDLSDCT